jgi:tRNA dimethylallyltransferase
VTQDWSPPDVQPDPRLRGVLEKLAEKHDIYWLHEGLRRNDPQAAAKIDPRNQRRTIRALEVIFSTGQPFTAQRGRGASPYRCLTIGLQRPRPELYARVDARIESMFANGFLDEVKRLLGAGYSPDLPTLSAIGYRECVAVLRGRMSLEDAKTQIKRTTRVFVRRQANWFKANDPNIHWFEAGNAGIEQGILALIRKWLNHNHSQNV